MRRKLGFCAREREISIDFDEHHRITTYNGLETCILNSHSFGNESGTSSGNGCMTDSFDEDDSASSSSITNPLGSFSSLWKDDEEKREHVISTDVETMKEKFAKLLLGEDVAGGAQGVSTALALSNAITSLAASVFGELWKLEALPEERASKWRSEMEWLLSPTKYMVELVPAKQDGASGRTLEIMTPQARRDICMNLPALRKLDSMLTETLESMGDREFWYGEVGSKSMRWWLPNTKVGLSVMERNRLLHSAKLVYQIFKAAKSINENVLVEMPVPAPIKDALPKSGKASLGDVLHKILSSESLSPMEMANCVNPNSEHAALLAINRLEAAILAWNERIAELSSNAKSPVRTRASWFFVKDYSLSNSEPLRLELLVNRAQLLVHHLKIKHPNLPHSFLDVTKIKYGKDVGHSILEAYSRVLSNLAFTILSRIGDILQQDVMSISNSPVAMSQLVPGISGSPMPDRVSLSLVHQHNCVDDKTSHFRDTCEEGKISSACGTPSQSRVW